MEEVLEGMGKYTWAPESTFLCLDFDRVGGWGWDCVVWIVDGPADDVVRG